MEVETTKNKRGSKRSISAIDNSDVNQLKRLKENDTSVNENQVAGKIKKIFMRNFMCHEVLEIELNQNVNFVVGRNGSGKSAILTALAVGLGAKANITQRGSSLNELIKKGERFAEVQISIANEGRGAYMPNKYGPVITVQRTIGNVSSYKIKNSKGEIVSTKRTLLDDILRHMNIQISNPISVMNQDVSRTFLVSSKPQEKYELFMKATHLTSIGENYKQAFFDCHRVNENLANAKESFEITEQQLNDVRKRLMICNQVQESRKQLEDLESELHWAAVMIQERKLQNFQQHLKKCLSELKDTEQCTNTSEAKSKSIDDKIRELTIEMEAAEREIADKTEAYKTVKQQTIAVKDGLAAKVRDLQNSQAKLKRTNEDITIVRNEITKLEGTEVQKQDKVQVKERFAKLKKKLDETEAMLLTNQTDQTHLEADKMRLQEEIRFLTTEVDRCEKHIRKTSQDLHALSQQSGSALSVYGPNMTRLLKRIEEANRNGRFKQKPRGPIGAYIKMKDMKWAPAVENFFGFEFLRSFCVDNSQDAKVLKKLMMEIYMNERCPQVICSRFHHQIHDVSKRCTSAPGYSNVLNAMDISDPIITNCLIDQREIECILLIPTNTDACHMMSQACNVPINCRRALTLNADTYFPDPQYRSYGGRRGLRAKFFQESTKGVIQTVQEELSVTKDEKNKAVETLTATQEKLQRTNNELSVVSSRVRKLKIAQNQLNAEITTMQNKIEQNDTPSTNILRDELGILENRFQKEEQEVKHLEEVVKEFRNKADNVEKEYKKCREMVQEVSLKIEPLEAQIRKLKDEQYMLNLRTEHAARNVHKHKQDIQRAQEDVELQERTVTNAITKAERYGPRVNTQRSINEIKELSAELKCRVQEYQQHTGADITELKKLLNEKEQAVAEATDLVRQLENSSEKHRRRLKMRRRIFEKIKIAVADKIRESFEHILALRKYKGTIDIDHMNKTLSLQVSANVNAERTKDTKSLSGGERSYSTVAFILALWEHTGLPFYFLDEFDVFMDKINRHTIMDLLLQHTKEHPECQFTFLTPLDIPNVVTEDFVTIYQLAQPEREEEKQQD